MTVLSHVYSEYTILASTNRIESLVARAKEFGYEALALTDHHVMYGAVPFYEACIRHGIKPIFGLEITIQIKQLHTFSTALLRLYAKNDRGYTHLLKLATIIGHKAKENSYLTEEELNSYLSDLIVIVPLENGPSMVFSEDADSEMVKWLESWRSRTNMSDWFLEIRADVTIDEQNKVNKLSEKTNIKQIASHPCAFLTIEDADSYQVVKAIKEGIQIDSCPLNEREMHYYLQPKDQFQEAFNENKEALENTNELMRNCTVSLTLGDAQLPKYEISGETSTAEFLRQLCEEGARFRYGELTPTVKERLEHELTVIAKMNFNDYFLIVWDFMKYAREKRIMTGPGRGSAAGSLVAYVLQITNVDPLKYDLLFERFLNIERISPPDIDIDFPDHRRDEVIEYVARKYGKEHVAQIITFGTFGARIVIRDVGKALGLKRDIIERVARLIPQNAGMTLEKAFTEQAELRSIIQDCKELTTLLKIAQKLEGLPRHTSTHAAGVVISERPLSDIVALEAGQGTIPLTQASMNIVERVGLLKFDFLGLRNLTSLEQMVVFINENEEKSFDLEQIPLNDKKTFAMLSKGETTGIFQLESDGMRRVLKELRPTQFEDIVAVNALYRPGPMDFIPTYINGKHQNRTINYTHPDLEPILKTTYGVIVYQEQIMQIVATLAHFTLAEADLLRRAISKKNKEALEQERAHFISGATDNGYDENVANEVFSFIEKFANYGFNKSHAVAYSMISYQLAYIKAHYPHAFYTALFSGVWNNQDKLWHHIQEFKAMGGKVLPPSLGKSEALFTIEGDAVRFGLLPISHVGVQAVREIIRVRHGGNYLDLFDFIVRIDLKKVTKKAIEQLIKAGAMDDFNENRATLLYTLDTALEFATKVEKFQKETGGLFTIDFEVPQYERLEPFPLIQKLRFEKEVIGFYLSGHPLETYHETLAETDRINIYEARTHGQNVKLAGIIVQLKTIRTKKGDVMAFSTLSDETKDIELVIFPEVWKRSASIVQEGEAIFIEGKIELSREKRQCIVKEVRALKQLETKPLNGDQLFLRIIPSMEEQDILHRLKKKLLTYSGETEVILYYGRSGESVRLSRKYAVSANTACLEELRMIIGNKNVVLKKSEN